MKVGSAAAVVSDDTLLLGATVTTFTVSLPICVTSPMSTRPTMREPLSSVSVSAALDNWIAVPPAPAVLMMAPSLVMVVAPLARIAVLPEMVPVRLLVTLALTARMPVPTPEIRPALLTFASLALTASPPEMVPVTRL